jgi:hypothetical protein
VADGARGRRWRATTVGADGRLRAALLLETDRAGAVAKLELATGAGLLTLHPEGDHLHGNVVRPDGIEHVSLPWRPSSILLVAGSPVTAAAAARLLAPRVGVGEGHTIPALSIREDLAIVPVTVRVARVRERRWRLLPAAGGPEVAVTLDDDGIAELEDGRTWPLELERRG